jgi:polysaccharide export outer membrane protein
MMIKNVQTQSRKARPRWGRDFVVLAASFALFSTLALAFHQDATLPIIEYRIGPNDLVDIKVFELPELSRIVRVSEDGTITLPMLEKIDVAGLTAQQLENELAALLEEKWLKAAHVTVFIREFQKVAVLGAIARPGLYELAGKTTLLELISRAGGLTGEAMDEIFIFRPGITNERTKLIINLRDLIQNGHQELDIVLQPKDEITVPVDKTITYYVYGEVKNPGMLSSRISAKMTLLKAIAQAGGPTEWAAVSKVIVNRTESKTGKEAKFKINLKDIIKGKQLDLKLEDGDIIIVP